jgi:hypothetical protein
MIINMQIITDLIFYSGLALLFTHELDAIQRHECRIFPFLNKLKDRTNYIIFTILHIPLLIF